MSRREQLINDGWQFTYRDGSVTTVDIPHTWNAVDGQDGGNDYWRGTCTYEKHFEKPDFDPENERVYLEFRGVNATADVTLNGKDVMHHDGGYSTFRKDITDLLSDGDNDLIVKADNSVNDHVYPQKADFTFYGGIYRDVYLIIVNKDHFDMDYYGGPGIAVTPKVNGSDADIRVQTWSDCDNATVKVKITDAEGNTVAEGEGSDVTLTLPKVHLWNGREDPYLYTCEADLYVDGENKDTVSTRFGVRTFTVDPKKGFYLNGKPYPLHGVSRHQDRKGMGNAITKKEHLEDMDLICEMGANTIRLAHYQHDQYFYDLADERGLVVWAEIPYISEHMPNGRDNTISQMRELIVQNYNHPSIVCWGISNEITISTKDKNDMLDNHRVLIDMVHEMDPTRFTTLACYAMCGPFNKVVHITDVVSWNLYLGWYTPGMFLNDLWINFFHLVYPNRCLGFSEYGCEAMPNLHALKPKRGDQTEEYQLEYLEFMLKCFERHPYMWATHVWNMFDFAADARDQGGEPGMNHKGLVTFDRKTKKDSFYLYKAYWSDEPFVYITGKRRANREEDTTDIKVYSNQPKVTLTVNGDQKYEQTGSHIFHFSVPLKGTITVEAQAGDCKDSAVFTKVNAPDPNYILKKEKKKSANWV